MYNLIIHDVIEIIKLNYVIKVVRRCISERDAEFSRANSPTVPSWTARVYKGQRQQQTGRRSLSPRLVSCDILYRRWYRSFE